MVTLSSSLLVDLRLREVLAFFAMIAVLQLLVVVIGGWWRRRYSDVLFVNIGMSIIKLCF